MLRPSPSCFIRLRASGISCCGPRRHVTCEAATPRAPFPVAGPQACGRQSAPRGQCKSPPHPHPFFSLLILHPLQRNQPHRKHHCQDPGCP